MTRSYRPGRFSSPVHGLPPNEDLPPSVHELADQWRALDDRLDEADIEQDAARADIEPSKVRDAEALKAAVIAGKPAPGKVEQAKAEKRLADAQGAVPIILAERDRIGRELARALQSEDSRAFLAERLSSKAGPAMEAYRKAVAKAQADVTKARSALARATDLAGVIGELKDANPSGIAPSGISATSSIDWSAALAAADAAAQQIEAVSGPFKPRSRTAVIRRPDSDETSTLTTDQPSTLVAFLNEGRLVGWDDGHGGDAPESEEDVYAAFGLTLRPAGKDPLYSTESQFGRRGQRIR